MQSICSADYKNPSAGSSDKKGALADASALQSMGIIVRREDSSGARTALSACFRRIGAFARTKLSALLWLR